MTNKKNKKYTGELSKPMQELVLPCEDGLRHGQKAKEIIKKDINEKMTKLLLLAKHYEIDESNEHAGILIALELAREHVPGFQRIKKAGAPKIWHWARQCELRQAVDNYIKESKSKINITQACKDISNNEPWKSLLADKRRPEEILRTQYYKIKPEDCKMSEQSWNEVLQEYEKRKKNEKS